MPSGVPGVIEFPSESASLIASGFDILLFFFFFLPYEKAVVLANEKEVAFTLLSSEVLGKWRNWERSNSQGNTANVTEAPPYSNPSKKHARWATYPRIRYGRRMVSVDSKHRPKEVLNLFKKGRSTARYRTPSNTVHHSSGASS